MLDLLLALWRLLRKLTFFAFCTVLIGKMNRMYLCLFTAAKETDKVFAFFHPYCDAGGGGERVLWMTIEAMLKDHAITKDMHIIVYSGSKLSKKELLRHVNERFSINLMSPYLSNKVSFVPIMSHVLMDAKWYPVATMIFQCLASVLVGIECICKVMPDLYMDTTGAAFTYPLFRLMSWPCTVLAYVHYPIISSDMLQKVRERRPDYNNSDVISKSTTISTAKLAYYSLVAYAYGVVGGYAHWVLANSSWTKNHIDGLWRTQAMLFYPPCNTEMNEGISLNQGDGEHARTKAKTGGVLSIVSVGQYRPEKDHALQLRAMKLLLDKYGDRFPTVQLVIIGSCRNQEDHALQKSLEDLASELGLTDRVQFVVNAPYRALLEWMAKGHVGLHSMWNEHFGISVVEMMAAGLVTVAHDTAGPAQDIVVPARHAADVTAKKAIETEIGYLAATPEEYAECLCEALALVSDADSKAKATALRSRARTHVGAKFSDGAYTNHIQNLLRSIVRETKEREDASPMHKVKSTLLSPFKARQEAIAKKED